MGVFGVGMKNETEITEDEYVNGWCGRHPALMMSIDKVDSEGVKCSYSIIFADSLSHSLLLYCYRAQPNPIYH
jgi:hypothetical protein